MGRSARRNRRRRRRGGCRCGPAWGRGARGNRGCRRGRGWVGGRGGLRTCGWPALRLVCLPANEHRRRGDDHEDTDDARADYRPAGVGVDPLLGRWVWAFVHRVNPSVGAVGFTSAPPGAWSSTTSGSYGGLRFPAIRKVKAPTAAADPAIQFARPPPPRLDLCLFAHL